MVVYHNSAMLIGIMCLSHSNTDADGLYSSFDSRLIIFIFLKGKISCQRIKKITDILRAKLIDVWSKWKESPLKFSRIAN